MVDPYPGSWRGVFLHKNMLGQAMVWLSTTTLLLLLFERHRRWLLLVHLLLSIVLTLPIADVIIVRRWFVSVACDDRNPGVASRSLRKLEEPSWPDKQNASCRHSTPVRAGT